MTSFCKICNWCPFKIEQIGASYLDQHNNNYNIIIHIIIWARQIEAFIEHTILQPWLLLCLGFTIYLFLRLQMCLETFYCVTESK